MATTTATEDGSFDDPRRAHESGRGRHAAVPLQVPGKGWLDILWRAKTQVSQNNVSVVAAGIAFYAFVAVVPALGMLIGLYGLITDASEVARHIETLARILPREVLPLLSDQMTRITAHRQAAGISAVVGFLLALYSSANATGALMTGLNLAYVEEEKRGVFRRYAIAFVLAIAGIAGAVLAVALLAALPSVLARLHITHGTQNLLNWLRWPLLLACYMSGLAVLFRYGPSRNHAKWEWVSWGALAATILWLLASGAFSLYVSKVGSYDKTYGPLGAVIVFLMWLYLSAYIVLIGAELNAEMERQTARDTTEGPEKPLGQRGARAADTIGPSRAERSDEC